MGTLLIIHKSNLLLLLIELIALLNWWSIWLTLNTNSTQGIINNNFY